jgi:hypothetical protein
MAGDTGRKSVDCTVNGAGAVNVIALTPHRSSGDQ